jgi:hypothetical protein
MHQGECKEQTALESTRKKKPNKITGIGTYLSIITHNINDVHSPMKRHRLSDQIKKQEPTIYCLQETQPYRQRHSQTESKRMENDIPNKRNLKANSRSSIHV